MKFLCVSLYSQVKKKTLIILCFQKCFSFCTQCHTGGALPLCTTVVLNYRGLEKPQLGEQGLKNRSLNALVSSEFLKLSGKGDTYVYLYIFIKKKICYTSLVFSIFHPKLCKSDCNEAVQFPLSVQFHLRVNFWAINSSRVGTRVICCYYFLTKVRVLLSKLLAYLHSFCRAPVPVLLVVLERCE